MADNTKLSFEEFRAVMAEELKLPIEKLTPETSLIQDLQMDSLSLAWMMLRIDELDCSIPLERVWEIETVGDLYAAYVEA
jgi:acyl carrier protein